MARGRNNNKNKEKDVYRKSSNNREDDDGNSDDSLSAYQDSEVNAVYDDESESLMDTLGVHIDNACHKNVRIRIAALNDLQKALSTQFVPEFVLKWKSTLLDVVIKNLKKTDKECIAAALLLANLALQIGDEISDELEEVFSLLRTSVKDPARSEEVRGACALSLALATHLACEEDMQVSDNIKALLQAWTGIKSSSQSSTLFEAALSGWALLLQNTHHSSLQSALSEYSKMTTYLESDNLEIRLTSGEVIAYLYELARRTNEHYRFPNHDHLMEIIDDLATDSTKQKTKRDKRVQRYSFRQILSYIEDMEPQEVKIKIGKETLVLDSCADKLLYDMCTEVLHGGIQNHLQSNIFLRDVFSLGPISEDSAKEDKFAKMAFHEANAKYRNQIRGKERAKRAIVC